MCEIAPIADKGKEANSECQVPGRMDLLMDHFQVFDLL